MKYLLAFVALALCSCDDEPTTVTIAKARFSLAFHPQVLAPGQQRNLYVTELRDKETGAEFLIVQDGGGLVVLPLPKRLAEAKP